MQRNDRSGAMRAHGRLSRAGGRRIVFVGATVVLSLGLAAGGGAVPESTKEVDSPRAAMQELFAQLQVLLPAAVSDELQAPERRADFDRAFERLQRRAEALPLHGQGFDPGARLFGRALARDIRRARNFYAQERFEEAAFTVVSLVDDCAACHTRYGADDALVTKGFVERAELAGLDPLEIASIETATRRFDDAMKRYEAVFAEPGVAPETLFGPIVRYLTVALRVARAPERARVVVARFAAHPDLAESVRKDVEQWQQRLAGLSKRDLEGTTLERARAAIERADGVARYSGDPRALVDYLIATAQLQDLSRLPQDSPAAAAEIYELLGRGELGAAQSVWLSRADLYWETSIRLAPRSAPAQRAYDLLEKETLAGFTGSGGLRLPSDEKARLETLKALVSGTAPTAIDGAELFANHCAICHGADGQGRGAVSGQLMWSPADLTRIATRRGGQFPDDEVFELISRRDPLGRHQSPEMPRWGKFWKDDKRIEALVAYLRSIQRP